MQVSHPREFKKKLLEAIKNIYSCNVDVINKEHPVIKLLCETNKKNDTTGWLFQLNVYGKRELDRSVTDQYLATALYNIIGCGCNKNHCGILATSLGSNANHMHKKKIYNLNIARTFIQTLFDDENMINDNDGSSHFYMESGNSTTKGKMKLNICYAFDKEDRGPSCRLDFSSPHTNSRQKSFEARSSRLDTISCQKLLATQTRNVAISRKTRFDRPSPSIFGSPLPQQQRKRQKRRNSRMVSPAQQRINDSFKGETENDVAHCTEPPSKRTYYETMYRLLDKAKSIDNEKERRTAIEQFSKQYS